MKKLLAIIAVAGFLAACNSGEEENTNMDTMNTTTPMYDTMNTMGTGMDTMGTGTTGRDTATMR